MSISEIRIELARLGWETEDRMSQFGWGCEGRFGYSVWVSRWEWHGVRLGSKVCFHCHVQPESLTPENIDKAWQKCSDKALAAWRDHPTSLPCQDVNGKVVEDKSLTKIVTDVHKGNPWIKS